MKSDRLFWAFFLFLVASLAGNGFWRRRQKAFNRRDRKESRRERRENLVSDATIFGKSSVHVWSGLCFQPFFAYYAAFLASSAVKCCCFCLAARRRSRQIPESRPGSRGLHKRSLASR